MRYIANKRDILLGRDLKNVERVNRSRAQIELMRQYCEQIGYALEHISDNVGEENLNEYAKSIDVAVKAMENAVFFGHSGYNAQPLQSCQWKDGDN